MKIEITGSPKEIAAFVVGLKEQREPLKFTAPEALIPILSGAQSQAVGGGKEEKISHGKSKK